MVSTWVGDYGYMPWTSLATLKNDKTVIATNYENGWATTLVAA